MHHTVKFLHQSLYLALLKKKESPKSKGWSILSMYWSALNPGKPQIAAGPPPSLSTNIPLFAWLPQPSQPALLPVYHQQAAKQIMIPLNNNDVGVMWEVGWQRVVALINLSSTTPEYTWVMANNKKKLGSEQVKPQISVVQLTNGISSSLLMMESTLHQPAIFCKLASTVPHVKIVLSMDGYHSLFSLSISMLWVCGTLLQKSQSGSTPPMWHALHVPIIVNIMFKNTLNHHLQCQCKVHHSYKHWFYRHFDTRSYCPFGFPDSPYQKRSIILLYLDSD